VIGNPGIGSGGVVLENAINRGVMSTKTDIEGQHFYQMGIAVNPGNSGGPVFDSTGQVIGAVTLRIPDKQELAFCIPVEELRAAQAKLAGQSAASARTLCSRHRLVTVFKDLTSAGGIYGLTLELHAAMRSGARSDDLTRLAENLDKAVNELEAGQFASLEREVGAMQADTKIVEGTRRKLGDLSSSYERLKTAYAQNSGGVSLPQVRSLKQAHRRLVETLKSEIDVEIPPQLLALYDDHVTVVAGRPNLGVNPAFAGPGSPLRSRIWERRGLPPPGAPGGRPIGPPPRPTRPGRPTMPRPGRLN